MPGSLMPRERRSAIYREAHGAPAHVFEPDEPGDVAIEAYAFDFSASRRRDLGYVLLTNGMSDRRMHLDPEAEAAAAADPDIHRRAELAWYVREPDPRYVADLRWLAAFPFIDRTWIGFGHTIPMPEPIFDGSELTAFLFLAPIIGRHDAIASQLGGDDDPVALLVVHALTTAEWELKREAGTDRILELFDEHAYPLVLDERRRSMV